MPRLKGAEQPLSPGDQPPLELEFEERCGQSVHRLAEVGSELIRMGCTPLQRGQDALLKGVWGQST